jgi:hypothetical protein
MHFLTVQPPPHTWTEQKVQRYKKESITIFETLKDGSDFLADRLISKIQSYRYMGDHEQT